MRKMIGAAVLLLLLVLVLDGYNNREAIAVLPEEMPSDFDFSVRYGITGKNEINTFTDEVTKDLVADGVAKTSFAFSEDEIQSIYEQMRAIPISDKLDMSVSLSRYTCSQMPYSEEHWTIILNGKTYNYDWSEEHCATTEDAKKLKALRQFIFNLVKEKEAYISLPESVGGYD
ncbi:hypothetical protein [Paenibacillus sp. HB172176]|uniref:hypothetical protein n=1 Tax=Paenibacillus sp. HB172176 TaxID=2493690 RepID=UPI00143C3E29|nr:hypothetical protein [Paenibacillus sp. HB172176]